MGIVSFPREQRVAIVNPREISAVESLLAALAAFIAATGGVIALGGADLAAIPLRTRIRVLGEMYAEGRVALDWRDGRDGRAYAATIEKRCSPRAGHDWRADVRATDGDWPGPVESLASPDADALSRTLVRALADGFARRRPRGGSRVAQFSR